MPESLFPPLDINDPAVPRAVALLRTTGDPSRAEFWSEEDPWLLIYALAAVASELGARYFGSHGAFLDALEAWQDTGGQLRSPDPGTP
jgi:hypothetical protein